MKQYKLLNLKLLPNNVKVRTFCNIEISFSIDFHIPQDSFLIFRFRGGRNNKNDWYLLQVEDPSIKGFANITTEPSIKMIPLVITGKDLLIKFLISEVSGLPKDTKLKFTITNTLTQSMVEMNKKIEIFIELPNQTKIYFSNPPILNILNDKFNHINIICPSIVIPKKNFKILLRIEDYNKNLVKEFQGKIQLYCVNLKNNKSIKIEEIELNKVHEGLFRTKTNLIQTPGIYIIKGVFNDLSFDSNPIECQQKSPDRMLFWGYIHGHTNKSDGMRDLAEYFNNLLDAGLDFGTNTEHDHLYETSDDDFKEIRNIVKKFHKDNEFVSFFGYEYGTWYTGYGDICIYHYDENIPIIRSEINKYNSPSKVIKYLKRYKGKVLMISHHSALRPGYRNWDYFDNTIEKLVEIYSTWGNQEYPSHEDNPLPPRYKFYGYGKHALKRGAILEKKGSFVRDALQKGYKLGFTAGGDDHFGFYPSGQIDPDNGLYPPGIMAIWAKELTKKSIWEALNDRKCYGTTGTRVILRFCIDEYFMGEIIKLNDAEKLAKKRILKISIISPILTEKIELIRNNEVILKNELNSKIIALEHVDREPFNKISLKHSSEKENFIFYYVRIFLVDNNMAWSSPIWIIQR
ncbi:MAG: DUF3604 domain-containing protein [Promethearchaeota archaeon]